MKTIDRQLLAALCLVTAAMTGIIWLVQVVVYPQFLLVGAGDFPSYHDDYTRRMGLVVGPLMIAELGLSIAAAWRFRHHPIRRLMGISAGTTLLLWAITFAVQVPLHEKLESGFSEATIRELVAGNWIRTALWTARSVLLFRAVTFLVRNGDVSQSSFSGR